MHQDDSRKILGIENCRGGSCFYGREISDQLVVSAKLMVALSWRHSSLQKLRNCSRKWLKPCTSGMKFVPEFDSRSIWSGAKWAWLLAWSSRLARREVQKQAFEISSHGGFGAVFGSMDFISRHLTRLGVWPNWDVAAPARSWPLWG